MSYSYRGSYCRECLCMDLCERNRYDEAYCTEWRKYYNPNSNACTRFKYDENRRYGSSSGGCYLTTVICNLLGLEDHGYALKTLRDFRDEYMLNHPETYVMLIEYDVVGPKIAKAIMEDPNRMDIARGLYSNKICPILEDIGLKSYDTAIRKYEAMTINLKNFYHIDTTIDKKLDINVKTLGKARA